MAFSSYLVIATSRIEEAVQLGLHDRVFGHGLGAVLLVVVRLGFDLAAQAFDPVGGDRVAAEVGVASGLVEHLLVAEVVEEVGQALAGQARPVEQRRAGLVCAAFLFAAVPHGA